MHHCLQILQMTGHKLWLDRAINFRVRAIQTSELTGTSEQWGQMADSKHASQCTTNSSSTVMMQTKGGGSSEIDDTGDPKLLTPLP